MEFIQQPDSSQRLGDYLKINLTKQWSHFRAAVAFVKQSGTRHLTEMITEFSKRSNVEIIAGIDHRGTSVEGLKDLLKAVKPNGRVIIFHNRLPYTFHPKIYLFKSTEAAEVLIGSGNLTEGGLFTNYEASIKLKLDLKDQNQIAVLDAVEHTLDKWSDTSSRLAHLLDDDFLELLTSLGLVPSEDLANLDEDGVFEPSKQPIYDPLINTRLQVEHDVFPFIRHPVPRAPSAIKRNIVQRPSTPKISAKVVPRASSSDTIGEKVSNFVMTLQTTDAGVGQTTKGTSRRSPEIFIPLSARNAAPEFWGWKNKFQEDIQKKGKYDRLNVPFRLGREIVNVNMMTWPVKHDFRLRCEALRSAGEVGDILRLKKVDAIKEYEYIAEIIPQGSEQYSEYLALCDNKVRNSKKKYGYF